MKYGARNKLVAKVKSVKKGDVMSLVKFDVSTPAEMASVLTTESVKELGLKKGDAVQLIKYHVLIGIMMKQRNVTCWKAEWFWRQRRARLNSELEIS